MQEKLDIIDRVITGVRANLVLLKENPTQTMEAYDGIAKVILRRRVEGNELAANGVADSE